MGEAIHLFPSPPPPTKLPLKGLPLETDCDDPVQTISLHLARLVPPTTPDHPEQTLPTTMSKTLRLGPRLRYPITIVNLLKQPGDAVKKQQPLFRYSYKWMKEVGDAIRDDTWEEEQTSLATFDSPTEGDLKQWLIKEGQVIRADCPGLVVKEACGHEIQFQGMCGICGKDMTEVSWASETRDTDRAPISMVHDQTNLTVSKTQAQRTESELQKRLLQSRKLTLVVDLDQTIIHACIDPTVGEWQKDPSNPNYESVKNVKAFQLNDGPRGVAHQCWYYIKMRPRLEEFLRRIATMYELHVYTMGTRAYAESVARIVDPDRKLFGNRVISRDENGNMFAKSLQRLFPVSTNMVVIIDDRADVWPKNRSNLIKVSPYDFFRGIGDINSSFLPKRQDIIAPAADVPVVNGNGAPPAAKKEKEGEDVVPAEGDLVVTQLQVEEQERTLEKQIIDRPLQLLQLKQDKEDEEAEKATTQSENSQDAPPSSQPQTRHQVLRDDDDELEYLEQHLTRLHKVYFEEHDRQLQAAETTDDFQLPDVGRTLSTLKRRAMRGVTIALTGLIPNGVAVEDTEIGQQLRSFGATVASRITRDVTHLVVNTMRPMTDKWRQARRIPSIKIVNQDWLAACFSQWATVDETPYLFSVGTNGAPVPAAEEASDPDGVSDSEEDAPPKGIKRLRLKAPTLKLVGVGGETQELDGEESDDEDDGEDELEAEFNSLAPDALADGQLSPIDGLKSFNWGSVDEELDEFLASGSDDDDDDEEDEDEGMTDADGPAASRKRKFDTDDDKEEGGTDSEVPSSQESRSGRTSQAKRLRRTKSARGASSLRNQYVSDVDGEEKKRNSLPTPQVTGDEDGGELNGLDAEMEAEMEAELMAEFEAAPGSVEEKG